MIQMFLELLAAFVLGFVTGFSAVFILMRIL